jgi:hypothetical protein
MLFVELVDYRSHILNDFSKITWFLNMLTSLSLRLSRILYLKMTVIIISKEFFFIDRISGLMVILSSFRTIRSFVMSVVFLEKISNQRFWWVLNVWQLILTLIVDNLLVITHFSILSWNFISLRNFFVTWTRYY